jgi:hypothetical protein
MRGKIEHPEVTQSEDGDSVMHLLLKDELLDAQLLRTVGSAPYGGADVGGALAGIFVDAKEVARKRWSTSG